MESPTVLRFYEPFSYEIWVPSEWQTEHPSMEATLVALEKPRSIQPGATLFWRLLDPAENYWFQWTLDELLKAAEMGGQRLEPKQIQAFREGLDMAQGEVLRKEISTGLAGKMANQLKVLERDFEPDAPLEEATVYLYAHLAAALTLRLELVDDGKIEGFWEVAIRALQTTERLRKGVAVSWNADAEPALELSFLLTEEYLWLRMFEYRVRIQSDFEGGLEALAKAADCCVKIEMLQDRRMEDGYGWCDLGVFEPSYADAISGLECSGTGYHLARVFLSAQDAANAFNVLLDRPPAATSWKSIQDYCWRIQPLFRGNWDDEVSTPLSASEVWPRDFWLLALGAAQERMSPSEFLRALDEARDRESEKRLSVYLFPFPLWNKVSEQARRSLVSADREYEATGGQGSAMLHHLREATTIILIEKLINPFYQATGIRSTITDLGPLLTNTFKEDSFWSHCSGTFGRDASIYLRTIEKQLHELNDLANDDRHLKRGSHELGNDASRMYRSFLGVGIRGILPSIVGLILIKKA